MSKTPQVLERLSRKRDLRVSAGTLTSVLTLAVELAREGREGRKVGTIFTVGDEEAVLARSRNLILDPLAGHPDSAKQVKAADVRETLKELAQLDGGFVVSDGGVAVSGARYFHTEGVEGIDLPLGLGTRHLGAAAISKATRAVAVVVSESAVVRVFNRGRIIAEILPELWMLETRGLVLPGRPRRRTEGDITVVGT